MAGKRFTACGIAVMVGLSSGACDRAATPSDPYAAAIDTGLAAKAEDDGHGDRLRVVATTTIVGDVVRQVGGDAIELEVILPPDGDPHAFQASPRDLVTVSEADVVFINGFGLESFLEPLLASAAVPGGVVSVSEGITPIPADGDHGHEDEAEHAGDAPGTVADEEAAGTGDGADPETEDREPDPHVWLDPANVMIWTGNIADALAARDPARAEVFQANAEAYRAVLADLDSWIRARLEEIPPERRLLVSDHLEFAYFAERYGFGIVGTVFPTTSTLSEPSAGQLAALEGRIGELGVPALFVGTTVSPRLAERVADDTGARLVRLYTGALSAPDGPAATYELLMRYDVDAIADALGEPRRPQ